MRVAIYIRVSTDEQVQEGYSIDAQKSRLIAFCHSQEWEIVAYYIEEGRSAKDLERPEIKRLLADAQDGVFDVVLVYKLDRLTRSVMDLYKLLETFEKHNIKFKSATEVYDTTTAMGKLFITIVAALAEWERNNLSERVRFGMEQMVREGQRPGGPIPFGYDNMGDLVLDEYEVCRELRRYYMEGNGFFSTAKHLNALGMLRRGFLWTSQSVYYVLESPYYAGKLRYGGKKKNGKYLTRKKNDAPHMLEDGTQSLTFTLEEYSEHNARMKKRSFMGYSKKREYWFTGILICGYCGKRMSGRPYTNKRKDGTSKGGYSYICGNRQNGTGCKMPMVKQELAEILILQHIGNIAAESELMKEIAATIEVKETRVQTDMERLNKELRVIQERKKKWQYMLVEDLISESDYRERKREEDEKERYVSEQIRAAQIESAGISSPENMELLENFADIWAAADDKDRQELMQTIFERVVLYHPEDVPVVGRKNKFLDVTITEVVYC